MAGRFIQQRLKELLVVLAIISVLLTGVFYMSGYLTAHHEFDAHSPNVKNELIRLIPIGTDVAVAQKTMGDEGFEYTDFNDPKVGVPKHPGSLFFMRTDGGPVVHTEWRVELVLQSDTVREIKVNGGYVGP